MNDLAYNNGTWPAAFVGAAYPHMLDRMVWEGMGAPGKQYEGDTVMLGRSAWAGSQRYGGAVWSGDTHSSFKDLNQQFRAGLNMVMSGMPYWTTDIGGYGGGKIDTPGSSCAGSSGAPSGPSSASTAPAAAATRIHRGVSVSLRQTNSPIRFSGLSNDLTTGMGPLGSEYRPGPYVVGKHRPYW